MITLWDKFKSAVRFVATDEAAIATMEVTPDPVWTAQPTVSAPNGPPSSPSDGIATQNAVVALLGVDMAARSTYIEITTWDPSGSYVVSIGMSGPMVAAQSDEDATLIEIASRLGSEAEFVGGRLVITTDEYVSVSTMGTGVLEKVDGDATAVDLVIWLQSGDGMWGAPTNGALSLERNLHERAIVAGYERVYIEVVATDGEVTPRVGPCLEVG